MPPKKPVPSCSARRCPFFIPDLFSLCSTLADFRAPSTGSAPVGNSWMSASPSELPDPGVGQGRARGEEGVVQASHAGEAGPAPLLEQIQGAGKFRASFCPETSPKYRERT